MYGVPRDLLQLVVLFTATTICTGPAQGGEVYKCLVDGTTAYRDTPCKTGEQQLPATGIRSEPATLEQMYGDFVAAEAQLRRAQDALDARHATETTRAREQLGLRTGQALPAKERERIEQILAPLREEIRIANVRVTELRKEAATRCPGGLSLGPSTQSCRQTPTR